MGMLTVMSLIHLVPVNILSSNTDYKTMIFWRKNGIAPQ